MAPVLVAKDLTRRYRIRRGWFRKGGHLNALRNVSLDLEEGKTLAIVGESGSGKSTLARVLAMVDVPDTGHLHIAGKPVNIDNRKQLRPLVQMVFQNPSASLNPRKTVAAILAEPLIVNTTLNRVERRKRIGEMLEQVGLSAEHANRYPHTFSGGQAQRIAIARAMILRPKIVIADEPTSALDVSIQAQILNLFSDIQNRYGTSFIFVSHDLSVVRRVADEVLVMYLGSAIEQASTSELFRAPRHPYTLALLSSTPRMGGTGSIERIQLEGELPSPLEVPTGCVFAKRCPQADGHCVQMPPALEPRGRHSVSCHKA